MEDLSERLLELQYTAWCDEIAKGCPLIGVIPAGSHRFFSDFLLSLDERLRRPFAVGLFLRRYPRFSQRDKRETVTDDDVVARYDAARKDAESNWKYLPIAMQRLMARRVLSSGFDPGKLGLSSIDVAGELDRRGLGENQLREMEQRKSADRSSISKIVADVLGRKYGSLRSSNADEVYAEVAFRNVIISTEAFFGATMPLTFHSSMKKDEEQQAVYPCFEDLINNGHNHWDQIAADKLSEFSHVFEAIQARIRIHAEAL